MKSAVSAKGGTHENLQQAVAVNDRFGAPTGITIKKADINPGVARGGEGPRHPWSDW